MPVESIHKGHRERMKQHFLEAGLDAFTDVQALELLLFYAVPQKDTNQIAHRLLDHFGSLSRVLDAPAEELRKISGISEHTAILLKLTKELGRAYQVDRTKDQKVLPTLEECGAFLVPYFFGKTRECVYLLCLDGGCKVLCCKLVDEGGVNSMNISPRKIVEIALSAGATTVVLAHNHPSGVAVPSAEDIQTTRRIAQALDAVEIILADHVVIAEGDYVSMILSGYRFTD